MLSLRKLPRKISNYFRWEGRKQRSKCQWQDKASGWGGKWRMWWTAEILQSQVGSGHDPTLQFLLTWKDVPHHILECNDAISDYLEYSLSKETV